MGGSNFQPRIKEEEVYSCTECTCTALHCMSAGDSDAYSKKNGIRKCLVESNNIPPPLKILTANEAKPLKPKFLLEEDKSLLIARRHYMQSFKIVRHPVHQCCFMTALSSPLQLILITNYNTISFAHQDE